MIEQYFNIVYFKMGGRMGDKIVYIDKDIELGTQSMKQFESK